MCLLCLRVDIAKIRQWLALEQPTDKLIVVGMLYPVLHQDLYES